MEKKVVWGIAIIALIFVFFLFIKPSMVGNAIESSSDLVSIPLTDITEQAKFYEVDSNGKNIKFFVIKAADGSIKTAFDACDVCYSNKKGYRQEGTNMVCNNCGNKYPISGLGTENIAGGGCWPGYLPSKIEGENLMIKNSDISKGEYRF